MNAIYGYDPAKWRLGRLCKHGHAWPGTQQSLRRLDPRAPGCAYCGASLAHRQTEHFLPISKGGTHVLSNILPACRRCNSSKLNHDPETWYRAQPFFTEQRWRTILRALGKQRVPVGQLSLV